MKTYGATALMFAAAIGSLGCVRALIEGYKDHSAFPGTVGDYIDQTKADGKTALMEAEGRGHGDCAQALRLLNPKFELESFSLMNKVSV